MKVIGFHLLCLVQLIDWLFDNELDIIDAPVLNPYENIADDVFWSKSFRRKRLRAVTLAALRNNTSTTKLLLSRGADFGSEKYNVFRLTCLEVNFHLLAFEIKLIVSKHGYKVLNEEFDWEEYVSHIMRVTGKSLTVKHLQYLSCRFHINVATGEVEVARFAARNIAFLDGMLVG